MALERYDLAPKSHVDYDAHWLTKAEADRIFETLLEETPWRQGSLTLFGRTVLEPRLTAWFGDRDYTYSGRTLRACPWPDTVRLLRDRVMASTGANFNSVLLNRYRDGKDSMGLHSDDEPELGSNPVIASVSLGAARRFLVEPKRPRGEPKPRSAGREWSLEHGSLLVMGGRCQHDFKHGVPKAAAVSGERINLTFRLITGKK